MTKTITALLTATAALIWLTVADAAQAGPDPIIPGTKTTRVAYTYKTKVGNHWVKCRVPKHGQRVCTPMGLRMDGPRVTPSLWAWATEASANVPLPDAGFSVWDGDPEYEHVASAMMFVPRRSTKYGWTTHMIRGSFLHELGHAYDYANMTAARREAFKSAVGVTCKWWAKHCLTPRWVSGPGVVTDLPPGEMFAEEYMACALGETRVQVETEGFNTYGWVPPEGLDESLLCALIRG